jgi:hypothetical protein
MIVNNVGINVLLYKPSPNSEFGCESMYNQFLMLLNNTGGTISVLAPG